MARAGTRSRLKTTEVSSPEPVCTDSFGIFGPRPKYYCNQMFCREFRSRFLYEDNSQIQAYVQFISGACLSPCGPKYRVQI